MAHVKLTSTAPGIVGAFLTFPDTAGPLRAVAEAVLRGPSSLSTAEREVIATHVSHGNRCHFCTQSHAAAARVLLKEQHGLMDEVLATGAVASDPKLSALLSIAELVRQNGKHVTHEAVSRARSEGADDSAIHHTILIAAAFCMFNRYVEGLGTFAPQEPEAYLAMGEQMAAHGYVRRPAERPAD